jgi:uncharacterized protein YyaL (SSP411 family)
VEKPHSSPKNHLAGQTSPYLLQHVYNPVDWYPWGAEAFAKAAREDKPVFLSVGYSTCHWCHVMERESFENEQIAALLNTHFVSIKVDREERPDVDRVYMTFIQSTNGSGGWPMNVFLTPDLKPFSGGTYFPPHDRGRTPGFPRVLKHLAALWKSDREKVVHHGNEVLEMLRAYTTTEKSSAETLGEEVLATAQNVIARGFDAELGGFGGAPKFPRPVTLNFLLRQHVRSGDEQTLAMAVKTLDSMAAGGMRDHLGGGFHRYSVDRFWHVPHFEKMLYDQAQLSLAYLDAFQLTREPGHAKVAREILAYTLRDLRDSGGGFYSAEDADSLADEQATERIEGAFYVWTLAEITTALGGELAAIFAHHYGIEAEGNAPEGSDPQGEFIGKNILIQRGSIEETGCHFQLEVSIVSARLQAAREMLLPLRNQRPRPHLDDKILTAWNGLMISALARAHSVLGEDEYLAAAEAAARFIERELMTPEGQLLRSYRAGTSSAQGFADDYAFFIQGLLDLYEAGFDVHWLDLAARLQRVMDARFGDEHGGYFSTTGEDASVLLRMKEDYDGAEPSPNSVAALNLLRLSALFDDAAWKERALKTLHSFSAQLRRMPSALPQMLVALDFSLQEPGQIVIAGTPERVDTNALLREVNAHFLPHKIVLLADGAAGQNFLQNRLPFLTGMQPLNGQATTYVCEHFTCRTPVADPNELAALLAQLS